MAAKRPTYVHTHAHTRALRAQKNVSEAKTEKEEKKKMPKKFHVVSYDLLLQIHELQTTYGTSIQTL